MVWPTVQTAAPQPAPQPVAFAPWPLFDDDQVQAVADVLRSGRVNYWTGEHGRAFEAEYARAAGRKHGIALANGTVAIELALHAFGIGDGAEVVTTSRTFIASASAVVMRRGVPIIADVDRDSQNVTVDTLEACITERTRALIVVHLAGWPCDMPAIMALARTHDLIVIEDCAQANGASIAGRPVGSFGHAAAFSFCQDKIITTGGEGGLLLLDDDEAWERAWSYKDHGKSFAAVFERQHPPGYRWLHESFGTNWRMTEVQAVLGRLQLATLDQSVDARRRHAARLIDGFRDLPGLRVPLPSDRVRHAYYKLYAFVQPERLRSDWSRDRVMTAITDAGVPCQSGSCSEIYRELAFVRSGLGPANRHPIAAELGDTALMFYVHPTLSSAALERTVHVVEETMRSATR